MKRGWGLRLALLSRVCALGFGKLRTVKIKPRLRMRRHAPLAGHMLVRVSNYLLAQGWVGSKAVKHPGQLVKCAENKAGVAVPDRAVGV